MTIFLSFNCFDPLYAKLCGNYRIAIYVGWSLENTGNETE